MKHPISPKTRLITDRFALRTLIERVREELGEHCEDAAVFARALDFIEELIKNGDPVGRTEAMELMALWAGIFPSVVNERAKSAALELLHVDFTRERLQDLERRNQRFRMLETVDRERVTLELRMLMAVVNTFKNSNYSRGMDELLEACRTLSARSLEKLVLRISKSSGADGHRGAP